jgi:flavin reductase (DIM6/NTAB) family NADH-FMN oxidoreductase RutF
MICRPSARRNLVHVEAKNNWKKLEEALDVYPLARLNQPVYSLATNAGKSGKPSMNLVTYCSPMSINPRTVCLGLYKGTQSWENFLEHRCGVLQVRT